MIEEGLLWTEEKVVAEADLAVTMKSGTLQVFSTPSMIALMEYSAWKCVEKSLSSDQTTVGVHIKVDHLKATLPGKTVRATSTVKTADEKKIVFDIEVFEGENLIGKAEHVRAIVNTARFLDKLNK